MSKNYNWTKELREKLFDLWPSISYVTHLVDDTVVGLGTAGFAVRRSAGTGTTFGVS